MRTKDELSESEYEEEEEEEEDFNIISDKEEDDDDNESISSELSETIKLREELPFTQLSPYKSDILKLLIENDLKKETLNNKLKTNNNHSLFKKKRVLFKEIHNETIGDIYCEEMNIKTPNIKQKKENPFTFKKRLPLPYKQNTTTIKSIKLIDPEIVDLNFCKIMNISLDEFVRIFSFLFFGVFLKDPSYDRYQLDLAKKNDEEISFIIKYFKFRLRTLRKEVEEEKESDKECNSKESINNNNDGEEEDEEEEERLITSKMLPLLSVLRDKVMKL